jgi:DUF1009 family protein
MLALICGTGALPAAVAAAQDAPPLVCALDGFAPDALAPDLTFQLEHLGSLLGTLGDKGVTEICLCGAIKRPPLDPAQIDAATLPLVPTIKAALGQGDDGALRAVIAVFEAAGFTIRAAHELAPRLLMPAGVPTLKTPGPQARADVQEALLALAEMSRRDVGQSCVVRDGEVIAMEGQDGTDAMLAGQAGRIETPWSNGDPLGWLADQAGEALQTAADWLSGPHAPKRDGGLLFKAPKPGQDRRADLPTIGPKTAIAAAEVGLDGIVIEANGVIVMEQDQMIRILDAMGMFLWVRAR